MIVANRIPVLVTTTHRGVFFGYADERPKPNAKSLVLFNARMCVHWSADVRGVLGLGASGPTKSCRITPAVPEWTVNDITAIAVITPAAAVAWEAAPWS